MQYPKTLFLSILCCSALGHSGRAQTTDWLHPMDLPVEVAGNFMELRNNHFHSGLDLKTGGRIGQPVKAPADGWVSRIKISPWGYGKAVYIDHPSGLTTVYGHLDRLNGRLADALLDLQYTLRDFSVDKYFAKGELPVTRGEVIAFSGNTGGSTAPHLHYEVRRTADQHALDPEAYGVATLDKVAPVFHGLRLYALDSLSRTGPYAPGTTGFPVTALNDSTYMLKASTNVAAWGTVGLAVNVTDKYSNSHNVCGVRSLTVSVDGSEVSRIQLDEVDFGKQRYANAYMDYALFRGKNLHYNRCYKLPNNRLEVYGGSAAPGRIRTEPGKAHAVQVVATDASGNRSTLTFVLTGAQEKQAAAWPRPRPAGNLYRYDVPNTVEEKGMRLQLPPNALYDDTYLRTAVSPAPPGALAPLYTVQDALTPLQLAGELSIEVEGNYPPEMADKLLIVRRNGGQTSAEGGRYDQGKVTATVKTLGQYTVMIDTVPPALVPVGLAPDMAGRKNFKVRIKDNLSGIAQWSAKLNGRWILMEYEPKTNTLEHHFDKYSSQPGKQEFELEVSDERGNVARLVRTFTR